MNEDFLGSIKKQWAQNRPFVLYKKPDSLTVTAVLQHDSRTFNTLDFSEKGFVFAPFHYGEALLIPDSESHKITTATVVSPLENSISDTVSDPAAKNDFEALVGKALDSITEARFEKVVLSRKESVSLSNTDFLSVFERLAMSYPSAFTYCWFHPQTGIWMGATPEKLLRMDGKILTTMALAGTQLFDAEHEAVWQQKDRQEQQFVTDFIVEELGGFASEMEVSQPYTNRAGNLVHIRTDIQVRLGEQIGLKDILEKLHPTPAVCGMPKAAATDFILENEDYDREYYAGFLGELDLGQQTDLYVNLRCMKYGKTAELFIGCGITRDSEPQKEFRETVNKSQTIKKVLI